MSKFLRLTEICFMVSSLLICTGGPIPVLFLAESEGSGEPDFILNRLIFLVIALIAFFLVLPSWKRVLYFLEKEKTILVLILVSVLSVSWSFVPDITLRRSIGLVATTVLGVFWGTRFNLRQQVELLAYTFGVAIVLSIIFALLLPKYGVMSELHTGAWRGIYTHKNVLGKIMVLSTGLFWMLSIHERTNKLLPRLGFLLSFLLILFSTSVSSLMSAVFLLGITSLLRILRWNYKLAISSVGFSLAVFTQIYIWLVTNLETFLGSFGKDATLTGRTDLWPAVLDMISKHPWLGYGYSGFWLSSEADNVWRAIQWEAPNAHNGFLDLWLELGLLGLLTFLFGFLNALFKGMKWFQISQTTEGTWPLVFLSYIVISNFSESSLLGSNSFFWVLYIGVSLGLIKEINRYRFARKLSLAEVQSFS